MAKPTDTALCVFKCIYMLLEKNTNPAKIEWSHCQKMMASGNFFGTLKGFDKENVEQKILKALEKFIKSASEMEDSSLKSAGKVALSLGKWSKAVMNYCQIAKEVEPLKKQARESQASLKIAQDDLAKKTQALNVEIEKVQALEEAFAKAQADMNKLEFDIEQCKARLSRAEDLTTGLKNEHGRWKESVAILDEKII